MNPTVVDTTLRKSDGADPPLNQTPTQSSRWLQGLLSWLLGSISTLLVLAAFGGLFIIGHHWDWKIPKLSEITGTKTVVLDDWCQEHSVPESLCVECDPTLIPKVPDYGWCPDHGVHNCLLHHPDVAQLKNIPIVSPEDFERAERALALRPRKDNDSGCKIYLSRIQFASLEAVQQAGVDVELVERQPISELVAGNGEITYDPNRVASLASRVPGTVWQVEKNIGDHVQKGAVLALIDAMPVGEAKATLLQALAEENLQQQNVERLNDAHGSVAGRKVLEAIAALAKARADVLSAEQALVNLGLPVRADALHGLPEREVMDRLRFLGIPTEIQSQLDTEVATTNLLPIKAPLKGVVVDRMVTSGEVVDTSRILFRIADMSRMWVTLSVPLEHIEELSLGQTVLFSPDGSRTEVRGKLNWISTTADRETRMVRVRAELPNLDGRLRNETFGAGRVVLREEPEVIVIPTRASHWEGCCQVVFVRDKSYFDSPKSPKVFHVRSVRLGATDGKFTEVIAGLLPGEVIATEGSAVLKAQLLKNNLGEGCACVAE